jgi:hypothetical protein
MIAYSLVAMLDFEFKAQRVAMTSQIFILILKS